MHTKHLPLILLIMAFLSACGGSSNSPVVPDAPVDDVTPPVATVTSLSITPRSALLARLDDTHQLSAELFDEDGAMVDKPVVWTSSDPNIVAVDEQGLLTSMGTIGSAEVTAEVDGVTSSPVIVAVVLPALNTQFVNDDQVVGDMELVDPESVYAPGAQYRVTLTDVDVPDIGTVLVAREDLPIAGGVVDVQQNGNEVIVTLEVLPLNELFTSLKIDQVFVPTEDDIVISQIAEEHYTMERLAEGSYLFTLLPGIPVAEPVASSAQAVKIPGSNLQAVRPADARVETAVGTVADNPNHPFDCSFSGPSFDNASNQVLTIQGMSPTIALDQDFALLTFDYDSDLGGLQKIAIAGFVKGTFTVRNKLSVQLEGKAGCKLELLEIRLPLPGVLALVLGAQIPLGIGFELSGKLTLAEMGFGLTASAQMATQSFGITCPNGTNCELEGEFVPSGEAKPVFDFPPGFSNPAADLKFEPALQGFGYADFSFGHPFFNTWRMTLANLQAGVKLGANLALVETQIDAGDYASDYKLSGEFSAKPGTDLARLLSLLGVSQLNAVTLTGSTVLLASPAAATTATPPVKEITADVANYTVGDVVTFTVKLDPTTVNFIPTIYNVNEVMIYRDKVFIGSSDPTRVERRTASDGQTEFTIEWIATESGSIGDEFHAFVSTDLLPLPYFGELELGKVRPPTGTEKIAFVRRDLDRNNDIYVMNADGSSQVNLTQNSGNAVSPVPSPDGNKIAFHNTDNNLGVREMFIMNVNGSNRINLSNNTLSDIVNDWSPDSSKLVFRRHSDNQPQNIFVVNADGSNLTKLTDFNNSTLVGITADWSPDGNKILFTTIVLDGDTDNNIYVMNADGSNQTNLTNNNIGTSFSRIEHPAWSPDGDKIIYESSGSNSADIFLTNIFIMDSDGTNQVNLTNDLYKQLWRKSFSPDGSQILFHARPMSTLNTNATQIFTMNTDGTNKQNLSNNSGNYSDYLAPASWSPDGSKIVFASSRDGNSEIYIMNADGSNHTRLTQDSAVDYEARWIP